MRFFQIALAVALLVACAKDKTQDDYDREQALKNLAQYQSVAGRYSGLMYSTNGNRLLGALQLTLRAQMQANGQPLAAGSTVQGTPILITEVTFADIRQMSIAANNGYYDPDTGIYQADISINDAAGKANTISISARIDGGHVRGTLQAEDYDGYGGTFDLVSGGDSLDDLVAKAHLADNVPNQDLLQLSSYLGTTTFSNGVQKPVRVVILQPRTDSDQDFLNLLVPIKTVQVSLNYDTSAHILTPAALWDLRTGSLTGNTSISRTVNNGGSSSNSGTDNVTLSFVCQTTSGTAANIDCRHATSLSGELVGNTHASLQTVATPDPVDNSDTANAKTVTFYGHGDWEEPNHPFQMTATYPARSRLDDILDLYVPESEHNLQVTLQFTDMLSVAFGQALWDAANGTIDANNAPAGSRLIQQLHCDGFHLDQTKNDFECTFSYNTSTSGAVNITFQPAGSPPVSPKPPPPPPSHGKPKPPPHKKP